MKRKKVLSISLLSLSLALVSTMFDVKAIDKNKGEIEGPEVTDYFTVIDENGNSKIIDFDDIKNDDEEVKESVTEYDLVAHYTDEKEVVKTFETKEEADKALEKKKHYRSTTTYTVEEKSKAVTYGVVYLNGTSVLKDKNGNNYQYIPFTNVATGKSGYTTGQYAKDAAYIGTFNGKIRAKQSGVVFDIDSNDASVIEYTSANISHYIVKNGYLYHVYFYGTSSNSQQIVGYALDYLKQNTKYYSYDGHYFYSDYPTMIKDYQNNVFTHAVNASNPYYNYYQYLSHRSMTTLTAGNFDSITNDKAKNISSKMVGMGKYYIQYQNTYGINALLMFGVSGNESSWGNSGIAQKKNNLFGHNAVDSDAYNSATGYNTPQDSIENHAHKFVSNGYLDNEDWRYNGGNLGDKACGMNVQYASDPYWGEKAASINYYYSLNEDYGRYTIGIINGIQKNYKLYKEPSYSSTVTHVLGNGERSPVTYNLPVIILDTITDSAGNKWYKIQSDTALNASRTDTTYNNIYSFTRDYLFIPATGVTVVNQGSVVVATPYLPGDVNGDGKVSSLDYIQIKNHIMQSKVLSGNSLVRADVNQDGKVTSLDYIKIKNHIMGTNKLF